MNTATLVRYGAATAIGLAMTAALLAGTSNQSRTDAKAREGQIAERLVTGGAQAIQAVDHGLTAMAQRLAAVTTATGGIVPGEVFDAAAQNFFARTDDTQGVVFFQRLADEDAAKQRAQALAEGITHFSAGGYTFYLAAAHAERDPNALIGSLAFSADGRIPHALSAGDETQRSQGVALASDRPVTSGLFSAGDAGAVPVERAVLDAEGGAGFWRFVAVRGTGPDGRDALAGILGTFVDAAALFPPANGAPLQIQGPVEAIALPAPGSFGAGGTVREVGISTGTHGFVLSYPVPAGGLSGLGWLFAVIGGLLAAGAALYTAERENKSRKDAERRLSLHKREFKKRTAELKRSEDRFRRLAESTNVIPWAADLKQRRFTYIGPQIERVSGYPAKSWGAKGFWVDHVHPDDRTKVFSEHLDQLKAGDYATIEYRIRSADGRLVHMRNMLTLMDSRTKSGEKTLVAQGYMLDITEMQTAQAVLDEARRAAEEANRSKSEFLANMSHELRTPLNAVIGFAEVMKDEVFGPIGERYQEYAENVHSSGKHLLSLINDVLDLSKVEAGKIELIEEETDLNSLLPKCRQLLHERASQAGLHIRLEIPAPLPYVIVDGRRIKQVILNLMSNAVKFTPPGGRITLRAEMKAPKGLKISVSDTGIGMTKEETEIALEQFGQIDSELSRQHEGTGLGLPIAKSLTEMHGGTLEIESKPKAGTTASIWLPLNRIARGTGAQPLGAASGESMAEAG